jgi:23S rRNA pseudouridine1911/1915/1917 synthase
VTNPPEGGEPPEAGWALEVDPGCTGLRLDLFLSLRIRRLSRARAARLAVVDLDAPGRLLKKSSPVHAGQRLWVRRPLPDADAPLVNPAVLFEDEDLLVLDKPPGLATHPTATRFVATVTHWLARRDPQRPAEPAHRLDVETSGVLVCGKHLLANQSLKRAFAERAILKRYLAVVEGLPAAEEAVLHTPLGPDTHSAVRLRMGAGDLPAETRVRVARRGRQRALVEAAPVTGRQHQIRCHLALWGHPVVGDKLYGPDEALFLASLERALTPEELARLGHPRQALHAHALILPWRGQQRTFLAPWPAELDRLVL